MAMEDPTIRKSLVRGFDAPQALMGTKGAPGFEW